MPPGHRPETQICTWTATAGWPAPAVDSLGDTGWRSSVPVGVISRRPAGVRASERLTLWETGRRLPRPFSPYAGGNRRWKR